MEPNNKEEALKMIEQLKGYIEDVDNGAWKEADVANTNNRQIYDMDGEGCFICCDKTREVCKYAIMYDNFVIGTWHNGGGWKAAREMAGYLNKNGYTKHKGE